MRRPVDYEPDFDASDSSRSTLMDTIDLLGRRIGGALVLAGALVGIGLYAGGGSSHDGPKYQAFAADGEVFRVNTDSGTIIACNASRCMRILERGQDLAEDQGNTLFKHPAVPQEALQRPAPVVPATQPAPAAQPAPATQPGQAPPQPR